MHGQQETLKTYRKEGHRVPGVVVWSSAVVLSVLEDIS